MSEYDTARRNMVENQLRPNRILDVRLLDAFGAVPRELFVPKGLRGVAYADEDIPLGRGAFLVEPLALGKLFQAAELRAGEVALVVGDVSGYAAAVMSRLAGTVFLLLPPEVAAAPVERRLGELGCDNVVLQAGRPLDGLPAQAPFDVILLVGALDEVPPALLDQLADGGRLVTVVEERQSGRVTVCHKVGGAVGRTTPFDAGAPRLPGLPVAAGFEF